MQSSYYESKEGFLKSQKGFGLIEVLVAAGLLAIVAVGVGTLLVNMQVERQRVQLLSTLNQIKTRYSALLTDDRAWNLTLNMNPSMSCITNGPTYCTSSAAQPFTLYYPTAGGSAPFPSAGTTGFTDSGAECNTFIPPASNLVTGTGDNRCPIGYSLLWEPLSTGQINTMVRVTLRLVYNGAAGNPFQNSMETSYKNSALVYPLFDTLLPIGKNDLQLVRNSTTVARQFTFAQDLSGAANPGGNCGAGAITVRDLNFEEDDPSFDLITRVGNTFRFNQAGLYKCSASAVGFGVGSFTVSLQKGTTTFASGNGFAGRWTQTSAIFETTITVLQSDVGVSLYRMVQRCELLPSNPNGPHPANLDDFGMGLPVAPYTTTSRFASVTCVKMD